MMVIMALVTTFMTGPANFINFIFKIKIAEAEEVTSQNKYRILISFGNNEKSLLRLANSLTKNKRVLTSLLCIYH
jgi:hypothetical protein